MILISENFGDIIPGNDIPGIDVQANVLVRPGFQAELVTLQIKTDDLIDFREITWPYTVIFIFGYSVVLYLSGTLKKEIHDRGSHLFYSKSKSFRLRFAKNRTYLVYTIQYAPEFIQRNLEESARTIRTDWEQYAPVFYYARSRITKRATMEQLSMLMFSGHGFQVDEFQKGELGRILIMEFLNETDLSFQPAHLGASQFEAFYDERDRLLEIALKPGSMSDLLSLAEIRQISIFRKRLRQLYGLNIREFITEFRMAASLGLLRDPTLSVKEIAGKTGFSSPFYFSRVFSNYFGMSPKHFQAKVNR